MAKSKKQPQQLLSPQNYIRQKARNLPVYECLINSGWKKNGVASLVVARLHANDHLTFAIYIVDLYCLGVKDTIYLFNASRDHYTDLIGDLSKEDDIIKADYALVHNIIFAAIAYAAELGFKPHKDFTSVTQYILEEDTDEIELIEIECGRHGKPVYVKTENTSESERIIKQLEKTVGPGNFDVIYGEEGDVTDFEDESGCEDEFSMMNYDEKRDLFLEMMKDGLDDISEEMRRRLIILTDSLYFMDICDDDRVDDLLNCWKPESEMEITAEGYTTESIGITPDRIITEEDMAEFDQIDILIQDNSKKALKQIKKLREKWGNIPLLCYQELKRLEHEKPKEYESKLKEYVALYPDYSLLKLEMSRFSIPVSEGENTKLINFNDHFEGRNAITNYEAFEFQMIKLFGIIKRKNLNEIEAQYDLIGDLKLSEDYSIYMKTLVALARINLLKEHLENN